mgnify:CR=1 FL=1
MFDYLVKLDDSIIHRYRTLETNIKSKSNSFYDSFLDLLEATIKKYLFHRDVKFDPTRTCGYLLREEPIEQFFRANVGVEESLYNKLIDFTKKANDHKHKDEKWVSIETVINTMRAYYTFSSLLAMKQGVSDVEPFNADYFHEIFGITEKQNKDLKFEVFRLKNELETAVDEKRLSEKDIESYKALLSEKQIESLTLEEQNKELQGQISLLKDIKLNSMEEKLNKTIDLLNDLQDYLVENRAISYGVGLSIMSKEQIDRRIDAARAIIKEKKHG